MTIPPAPIRAAAAPAAAMGRRLSSVGYYDPTTGQFLSTDPLVETTEQPYEYAGDDPVSFTDPSGELFGIDTGLGTAIGAIVGGAAGAGGYLYGAAAGEYGFSWSGLGVSTVSGAIGGAVAGACIGTTWLELSACGAFGGLAATLSTNILTGNPLTCNLTESVALGAAGGAIGGALFRLQGFRPYKFSNIYNPGINAARLYGQAVVSGNSRSYSCRRGRSMNVGRCLMSAESPEGVAGPVSFGSAVPAAVGAAAWLAILVTEGLAEGLKYSWILLLALALGGWTLLMKLRYSQTRLEMSIGPWRRSVDLTALQSITWRMTGSWRSQGTIFIHDRLGGQVPIYVGRFSKREEWGPLLLDAAAHSNAEVDPHARTILGKTGARPL